MLEPKRALKWLIAFIGIDLAAIAFIVILFDPFYQYHRPIPGMQEVLYDRDNQVPGTIRTYAYDTVLLGSSVVENFDTDYMDTAFGGHALKIIRASGSAADLLYYLEQAHEGRFIRHIFWGLDIFALTASTEVTLYSADIPRYLHTKTVLDDFPYLFNKEILFEKIPLMLFYSGTGKNTAGRAYDWSEGKIFEAAQAMRAYEKPAQPAIGCDMERELQYFDANISAVWEEISGHPETEYTIFFPPYSMLWWDCGYTNGIGEVYFYVLEKTFETLLPCENVSLYFFQADRDIICDLDNYMDMVHYSPKINQYMLECMAAGSHEVTAENAQEILQNMKDTYEYIIYDKIYEYYGKSDMGGE